MRLLINYISVDPVAARIEQTQLRVGLRKKSSKTIELFLRSIGMSEMATFTEGMSVLYSKFSSSSAMNSHENKLKWHSYVHRIQ